MRRLLLKLFGVRRDKLVRKPYVIVRHAHKENWTNEDRDWLRYVVESERWQKLMRRSDIDTCNDVLGNGKELHDTDFVRALAAGRMRERHFIARHSGAKAGMGVADPEQAGYFTDEELPDGQVVGEERSTIQEEVETIDSGDIA